MDLFDWATEHDRKVSAPARKVPGTMPAGALPPEFHAIVDVLRSCLGPDHSITAEQIANTANLWPDATRESRRCRVRRILRIHFRELPFTICGLSNGYFRPLNAEQVSHYDRSLESRRLEILQRRESFRLLATREGYHHLGLGRWVRE